MPPGISIDSPIAASSDTFTTNTAPANTSLSSDTSSRVKIEPIVGGAVGGIALLSALLAGLLVWSRTRQRRLMRLTP
jgi:hypothetical protein